MPDASPLPSCWGNADSVPLPASTMKMEGVVDYASYDLDPARLIMLILSHVRCYRLELRCSKAAGVVRPYGLGPCRHGIRSWATFPASAPKCLHYPI